MITRSDVRTYGSSPTYFSSLISSEIDECPMYHSEISYNEAKYPTSSYEMSQDANSNIKEENTSVAICRIVDDMLTSDATLDHDFSRPTEFKVEASNATSAKGNASHTSVRSEKVSTVAKDDFNLKDEFGTFSCSDQEMQSESPVTSDKFSNPLCQTEKSHCSSPYSETKSDSEINVVKPTCLEQRNYDTSALMYDNDDMTTFSGLVNCDEVLKNHKRKDTLNDQNGTIVCCYRSGSLSTSNEGSVNHNEQADEKMCLERSESYFSPQETSADDTDIRKGKISGLQRRALDSIFNVIDRPSRGLVLHIAGELCLHHITVKNFFSNGRRRLRRAAARLNDPERTRRENQKRKEKRRLAALAAAASFANGEKGGSSSTKGSLEGGNDSQSSREPPVLSPERRALMEKLAVKVQRSVAQKELASGIGESACLPANLASSTMYNPTSFSTKNLENNISSQLHSNSANINEPSKAFAIQQVDDSFLNQNGEEFSGMFSYTESDPMTSYDSSPDQNSVSNYSSEQENTNSYALVNQEGPYSPTSWQTLLHT